MAFTKEPTRVPTAIGDMSVQMFTPAGGGQGSSDFSIQVMYSDGTMQVKTGNLVPHLTQAQINQLQAFMDALRTKAISEILP